MGYKIRELREKREMTQEELAKRSGVCRATICLLESDSPHNASLKTLCRIASALDTTVEEIFFTDTV